jgi:hypothetical protein
VLRQPGTTQIGDIRVVGHAGKHADPWGKEFGQTNTIWLLDVANLRIVHLGDNGPLRDETARELGRVDVLMMPIDSQFHILKANQIAAIRSQLSPSILIPMHYSHADLETHPDKPEQLGGIADWAKGEENVRYLASNQQTFSFDELPPKPEVMIFNHSPLVAAPAIMFHPASSPSLLAFLVICAGVVVAFLGAIWISARRESASPLTRTLPAAIATLLWLTGILFVVGSEWLQGDQRRVLFFAAVVNAVSLAVGFSPVGRWLTLVPLSALVAFQGFRLPLELVLHSWVAQGVIPSTMTWSGRNWDIVSGVVALIAAPFCRRSKIWAWIANGVGLALLVNVVRVAVLSSPLSFGWPVLPKLELIYHIPYALIIPVCIGGALIGHIALTRALLRREPIPRFA